MEQVTATTICNEALVELGDKPVGNIYDDTTERALQCRTLYPRIRLKLLRDHFWKFAMKRAALAPNVDKPEYGWTYAFTPPADILRLKEVSADPKHCHNITYEYEGGLILCDCPVIYIRYVANIDNENKYDETFKAVLVQHLKASLAFLVTGSLNKQQLETEMAQILIRQAMSNDSMEVNAPVIQNWDLEAVRFGWQD